MKQPVETPDLCGLPEAQRERLIGWMLERTTYYEVREHLRQEFQIETNTRLLNAFYQRFCAPLSLKNAAAAANALPELAGGLMANWDDSSVALVKQRYFELLAAPTADPKQLALFATQVAQIERVRLNREKLQFQRQQARQAARLKREALAFSKWKFETKAAELALHFAREIKSIAANRALDADAKIEQVRQRLFGAAPEAKGGPRRAEDGEPAKTEAGK